MKGFIPQHTQLFTLIDGELYIVVGWAESGQYGRRYPVLVAVNHTDALYLHVHDSTGVLYASLEDAKAAWSKDNGDDKWRVEV